ncbi:hypothetical protein [Sapientia aquatica]|nr:hypothetical protein [Sapientia aquatica]
MSIWDIGAGDTTIAGAGVSGVTFKVTSADTVIVAKPTSPNQSMRQ